jgi:hypothetical protein
VAGLAAGHGGGAGAHGADRYGGIPSWLPKATVPVGRVLRASAAHPVLAIQGDTVSVAVGRARVRATAVGPAVPEEGRFPVPETSPCTFVVTFTRASTALPLRPGDFTLIDELHHVHHPRLTALDGGAPPRRVAPGRTVSVKVRAVLPTGDGGLEWAPGTRRPLVAWDYVVEID